MSRTSKTAPPSSEKTKRKPKTKSHKHAFSALLAKDARVASPPRHVEVVYKEEGKCVVMVKIYAGLSTPGSELMTVSWVDSKTDSENEIRFDEKYPVWMRFKTQDDASRVAYAKEQILRAGGYEKLRSLISEIKFSV